MQRTIQTTYRFRLHPTAAQEIRLKQFAGARRFVWNWSLGRKQQGSRNRGKAHRCRAAASEGA